MLPDTEIRTLLAELKAGIEATATGIFDGAQAWLHASSESSQHAFWDAFNEMPCLQADWGEWDRELLLSGSACVRCRCGAHSVEAFMVHKRWILIVLAGGRLFTGAAKVIEHALVVLEELLPSALLQRSPSAPVGGQGGGSGSGPAELAIPAWWIRRRTAD